MSMRVVLVAVCLLLVADTLVLLPLSHFIGWGVPVAEMGVSAVIGLAAIGWYEWRWSNAVADQFEPELQKPGREAGFCAEKMLLLVAGVLLILPGFLSDGVGLLLLLPGIRRLVVQLLPLCASGL